MGRRGGGGGMGGGRSSGGSFGGSRGSSGRLGGNSSGRRGSLGGGSNRGGSNRNFGSPRGGFGGGGYYGGGWGYGRSWGWGRRRYYGGGPGGGCGLLGCLGPFLFFIVLLNFIGGVGMFGGSNYSNSNSGSIQSSSRERTPLEPGAVNETEYFTDIPGWIGNATTLENGMRHFYNETGVQPYLYITEEINGNANPTQDEITAFQAELYDDLFTDEAHALIFYFRSDSFSLAEYYVGAEVGSQARSVMDREAQDILYDYLARYYESDIEDDEYFARSFQETADRMMTTTQSPWITPAIIAGGAVLVGLLFVWWRNILKKDKEAARPDESYKTKKEDDDLDF
ncbi:hypothetical protein ACFP65_04310 [Marinilactibacillus sp. GCM10026970]|uniref:hypothetical protein n=1 Tax=Marinilactibacillus sp. GCM10026970 TaxID=3252642 RepID=UPI0036132D03